MIIQILLSLGLLFSLFYALVQPGPLYFFKFAMSLVAAGGIYFVWFPEKTTDLAAFLGVGRGADLVFYSWIMVALVVILNLHLRSKKQDAKLTKLAREFAKHAAITPDHVDRA